MTGPILQDEVFSILIRFRIHPFVVSADVEKMYRQILVSEDQHSLQRILWRMHSDEPLQVYDLTTVTYGMKCSTYLAINCLYSLGVLHEVVNVEVVIIKSDFYVDDLLTGFESVQKAKESCKEIIEVLKSGGFPLRKFYSNYADILTFADTSSEATSIIHFGENENAKTLGLSWSPHSDVLLYKINPLHINFENKMTKRCMLSDISQIFDPLGLLSPCIIIAKVMLQRLWLEKISWDDPLPVSIENAYLFFRHNLIALNNLRIRRHVGISNPVKIELHGFCDSSQTAYGACILVKSARENKTSVCHLLCAKSKVAPLKTVSLPRLEFCGAVVLARLVQKLTTSLRITIDNCVLWTDSSIVLSWIKTPPNTLKTFVSNRVAEIQEITKFAQRRHVPSKDNPADILSRGIQPEHIIDLDLWWQGPTWLTESQDNWPNLRTSVSSEIPEVKNDIKSFITNFDNKIFPFERFSNLSRLKCCMAYILRFIKNSKIANRKSIIRFPVD